MQSPIRHRLSLLGKIYIDSYSKKRYDSGLTLGHGVQAKTNRTLRPFSSSANLLQGNQTSFVNQTADQNQAVAPYVDSRLSYAFGRSFKELKYCSVSDLMSCMSEREPHSTAIVVFDEGVTKSFSDLNKDVNRLVNGMIEKLNLERGDRVAVYSYNTYSFVLIHLACTKLGLLLNTINPSYKAHEFSHVIQTADAKVLFMPGKNSRQSKLNDHWAVICDQSLKKLRDDGKLGLLSDIVITEGEYDKTELTMDGVDISPWREVFQNNHELDAIALERVSRVCPDDIYGVYYTSGTTGIPKGATITQFNVINNAWLAMNRVFGQREPAFRPLRPNVCLPLPLFHQFAGVLGMLLPFTIGGSIVFPGIRYNIETVVESIMRFKCNSMFLTPTILIDLLGHVERKGLTKIPLRTLLVAGSPVMSELVHRTYKVLPDLEEVRIGYGSSENGVIASIQTTLEQPDNRPYTVGPPLDFTEIRIVDTKSGEPTLLGQSGEVQTRGFNTMLGYYNDEARTNEVICKARWYKTGDLGILDKYGSLQIVGRSKELIIKGGENIYPKEVESVLHAHDAIEDAHVFGVPDKRFGEEVCTWVKLNKSKMNLDEETVRQDILKFCKQRLTYFKVPKYVIFVREFPLTPVKKIKKYEMRAQTSKMLNLN